VKKKLLSADQRIADAALEWFFSKTEGGARPFAAALWAAVLERRKLVIAEQFRRLRLL
jgi:hypothetical protein